jgi:Ethanolamine utilization protein EutJ (predicted chaperonin)
MYEVVSEKLPEIRRVHIKNKSLERLFLSGAESHQICVIGGKFEWINHFLVYSKM